MQCHYSRAQAIHSYRPRQEDVIRFYSDPNPSEALQVLQRYDVSYVIIGQLERIYYAPAGLAKFDDNLNGNLELVYENPGTTIYRVLDISAPVAVTDLEP